MSGHPVAAQQQKAHIPITTLHTNLLQRKCACGGTPGVDGECAECRSKRLSSQRQATPMILQTKLTVNKPGDQYEQEADRMVEQVMRMPEPVHASTSFDQMEGIHIQRLQIDHKELHRQQETEEEDEELHRQPMEEEEDEENLQAKEVPGQTPTVTPALQKRINSIRSTGQLLPRPVRSFMEPRFGHDFSQVRIHADAQAAETAQAVHARAYTLGRDVVFGAGQYAPETIGGKRLLAHELTHVVQQGGLASSSISMNSSNDAGKRDANHTAPSILTSSSTPLLQREEEDTSPAGKKSPKSEKSVATPCPTSVRLGQITRRNYSNLPDDRKSKTRTYLSARTHMHVDPGPNHLGHCMKETVTVLHSNCPEAMFTKDKKQKHPCTGDKCLVIGDYNSGPSAFIDTHFTKAPVSLLEGTSLKECSITCEQTYSCDRKYPATGRFLITRNFVADSYTGKDGKKIHITTGKVEKTQK